MIERLEEHIFTVFNVAWSPDGNRLATAGLDNHIIIWDRQNWEVSDKIIVTDEGILSLAWSPDGSRLAGGSGEDTVLIWDFEKQEFVQTLDMDCPAG